MYITLGFSEFEDHITSICYFLSGVMTSAAKDPLNFYGAIPSVANLLKILYCCFEKFATLLSCLPHPTYYHTSPLSSYNYVYSLIFTSVANLLKIAMKSFLFYSPPSRMAPIISRPLPLPITPYTIFSFLLIFSRHLHL